MITQVRVLPSLLPGERSLKRSTDQSTGADSQRNAERIGNIPLRKESKSGIAVVAKWKTLEDLVLPILKTRRARRGLDGTLGNAYTIPKDTIDKLVIAVNDKYGNQCIKEVKM